MTEGIINMGVEKILVVESLTDIRYEVSTLKHFNLNSFDIDYANYKFTFDGDKLTIDGLSNYSVSIVNGGFYLDSPQYSGEMIKISSTVSLDNNAIILLHFAEEITTSSASKKLFSTTTSGGGAPCSFWDTYYYYVQGLVQVWRKIIYRQY
ncbi:hypothetical protein ABGT15_02270 [Flavobacterium enshiense]|uniref:hypothetical protein n=1 Tax=Flavobacterium enshiense TaxID=1341165 RepID=UPI00345CBA68